MIFIKVLKPKKESVISNKSLLQQVNEKVLKIPMTKEAVEKDNSL